MTVKKSPGPEPKDDPTHPAHYAGWGRRAKPPEPKEARISLRLHDDLREALEFIAEADRRPLSTFIEHLLIDHAAAMLANPFLINGERDPADKGPLRMKTAHHR